MLTMDIYIMLTILQASTAPTRKWRTQARQARQVTWTSNRKQPQAVVRRGRPGTWTWRQTTTLPHTTTPCLLVSMRWPQVAVLPRRDTWTSHPTTTKNRSNRTVRNRTVRTCEMTRMGNALRAPIARKVTVQGIRVRTKTRRNLGKASRFIARMATWQGVPKHSSDGNLTRHQQFGLPIRNRILCTRLATTMIYYECDTRTSINTSLRCGKHEAEITRIQTPLLVLYGSEGLNIDLIIFE